ncbi:MAG: uL14 family ribosomal protein [Candidatus ainarchaeum sp.]|nr:uL14 family ribosomal protein [Candidatus ainarchaeum sp.]MDD3975756.1 uL14 family ribosomal protein [Candidatus ainarchaeum sp.]
MKQISANVTRGLCTKSQCVCTDNSGAKIVEIISVYKFKNRKTQFPSAGIGSLVNVVVKKGTPNMKKKIEKAVIVRVKKEYRRKNGKRICFEDNAVVLTDLKGFPKASEVKGCVAKEVGERYPKIAGLSSAVI